MTVPHFIFMLTRNDRTLDDAHGHLQDAITSGIRHIGFKNVGLSTSALKELSSSIRACGASVYLEVVSLDEASEVASAQIALSLEVDYLLGGTRPEAVLPVIRGSAIEYYPFAGTIVGHPSRLVSSFEDTVANSKALTDIAGVDGIDLLAYRFDGDAAALIANVCARVAPKRVIVAGSIDRAERIAAVVRGGAAAFTVGTAALDGKFPAVEKGLAHQLRYIELAALRCCKRIESNPNDLSPAFVRCDSKTSRTSGFAGEQMDEGTSGAPLSPSHLKSGRTNLCLSMRKSITLELQAEIMRLRHSCRTDWRRVGIGGAKVLCNVV